VSYLLFANLAPALMVCMTVAILAAKFDTLSKPAFIVCFSLLQVCLFIFVVTVEDSSCLHPVLFQLRGKYVSGCFYKNSLRLV
jgi:hypothetical protein